MDHISIMLDLVSQGHQVRFGIFQGPLPPVLISICINTYTVSIPCFLPLSLSLSFLFLLFPWSVLLGLSLVGGGSVREKERLRRESEERGFEERFTHTHTRSNTLFL